MINPVKGAELWKLLHETAKEEKDTVKQHNFMCSWWLKVEYLLGCASCFRKLKRFIDRWPVDFGEGFYLWTICLHDFVNKEMGRKLFYPKFTLAPLTERGIIQ